MEDQTIEINSKLFLVFGQFDVLAFERYLVQRNHMLSYFRN